MYKLSPQHALSAFLGILYPTLRGCHVRVFPKEPKERGAKIWLEFASSTRKLLCCDDRGRRPPPSILRCFPEATREAAAAAAAFTVPDGRTDDGPYSTLGGVSYRLRDGAQLRASKNKREEEIAEIEGEREREMSAHVST